MFYDRNEAAFMLAEKLSNYKGMNPLILAIPRGSVPMAKIIANAMDSVPIVSIRNPNNMALNFSLRICNMTPFL